MVAGSASSEVVGVAGALGEVVVVGDDRAALEGRDDLRRVEAEHLGLAEPAEGLGAEAAADAVRGVEEESQVVQLGDLLQLLDGRRLAPQVHADQSGRAVGDQALDLLGVDAPGRRVEIAEDRRQAEVAHRVRGRDVGHGRHDDLAGEARRPGHHFEGDRPVAGGDAVLRPGVLGDPRFELLDQRAAAGEASAVEGHFEPLVELRPVPGAGLSHHQGLLEGHRAAEQCQVVDARLHERSFPRGRGLPFPAMTCISLLCNSC
jgi:hypothetical protein